MENSPGYVDKENRKSQPIFECQSCGHKDNADNNAALNILIRFCSTSTSPHTWRRAIANRDERPESFLLGTPLRMNILIKKTKEEF